MVSTKQELLQKYQGTFTLCCKQCYSDSVCTVCKAGDSRCGRKHALWNDWDYVLAYDEPVDEELVPPTIIQQPGSKVKASALELDVWRVLGEWTNVCTLVTEPRFLFGEEDSFSCQLCNRSFETEAEFQNHVHSEEHMTCMRTHVACKARWPPQGYSLELCYYYPLDRCYHGDRCAYAHSEDELCEWREWDIKKRNLEHLILMNGLQPWARQLRSTWSAAQPWDSHFRIEDLFDLFVDDGTSAACRLQCDQSETVTLRRRKNATFTWRFTVAEGFQVMRACLFDPAKSKSFWLQADAGFVKFQELNLQGIENDVLVHDFEIVFQVFKPGRFEQWLVVDFGQQTYIRKKLCVVVEIFSPGLLLRDAPAAESPAEAPDRWGWETHVRGRRAQTRLMLQYKPPDASLDSIFFQSNGRLEWTDEATYRMNLHCLLKKEEEADTASLHQLSAEYTLVSVEEADDASSGHRFHVAKFKVARSASGGDQLLLSGRCRTAWLRQRHGTEVVEAQVAVDAGATLLVELWTPSEYVHDAPLRVGDEIHVQFQLDRHQLCSQHAAIDDTARLVDRLLLPDLDKFPPPSDQDFDQGPTVQGCCGRRLQPNRAQNMVSKFARCSLGGPPKCMPPLLVYGPWGAGKTLILASTAIRLIRCQGERSARVLICTHTNSAADLFINAHFSHKDLADIQVRRLSSEWRSGRMSEAVWQCSRPYLSWEETCSSQIVVTTFSMARTLRRWVDFDENLFTHIFIDEGGQATEPEALQAVACAGPHTCLIIAGDHKQMHSASSSLFAEECGQEVQSLLRRLFARYQGDGRSRALRIFLNENYRSDPAIVKFIGPVFYERDISAQTFRGPCRGHFRPLHFIHVEAAEAHLGQDSYGCSNEAEVAKVMEVAESLHSGGEKNVGVISSELSQVWLLQRRRRSHNVGYLDVQRILNIQGQEFDTVIVSTVASQCMDPESKAKLGFLREEAMLNVAMTRARRRVIVVGDACALTSAGLCAPIWRKFIEAAQDLQGCAIDEAAMDQIQSLQPAAAQAEDMRGVFEEDHQDLTDDPVLLESMLGALHLNMAGVVDTHDRQKQIEKKLASTLAAGAPLASTPLRRRRQPHGRDVHRGRELNIRPPVLKFLDANAPSWWLSGQLWRSEDRTIKRIVLVGEKPSIARAWVRALLGLTSIGDVAKFRETKARHVLTDVYRFERDFQEAPAEWIVSATTGHFTDIRMAYGLPKQLNGAADPDIFERELEVDCISDEHQKMRTQLRLIANGSDLLILALDADMEGECIARQVAQVAEPRMRSHDVRRCWFTSLGQTHLLRALESLRDLNEAVADACEVRRHVDYRLGQAGTLALNAFAERHRPLLEGSLPKFFRNRHGRQHTEYAEDEEEKEAPALSYGPVQTAAIFLAWHHHISEKLKVKQESDKRWRVKLTLQSDLTGKFECFSDLIGEGAAQEQRDVILQHVRPGLGPASPKVNKAVEELVPGFERPKPLNFVGLLKLAAAYGFKPSQAADAAQTLYVKGFISYPRTESSVYSDDEEATLEDIVQDIATADLTWVCKEGAEIQRYAGKLLAQDSLKKPRRGFLATGDHEPITPLLQRDHTCDSLGGWHSGARDLYTLILRYFLASLSPDCVMQAKTVTLGFADIEVPFGGQFRVQHRTQVQQGWLEILPIDTAPLMLHAEAPVLRQDASLEVVWAEVQEESPEAEKPLTVARLLHLMEVHGIGTDASIPEHFEKLLKREYFELCKKHFAPRVKMSEAYWAWHVLQDDEFEVEMFWNPAESKGNLLKLFVTDMGQALVTWLWNNERQLVQPTLRAEIEERTRAVAYSGESAGDVSRQLTGKFRDLYMSLAAKLDETDKDSFTGADLLRLLSPTRKGQRGNEKDDMKSCACHAMARMDLRDLEVKRSATLQRHGPDLQHAESYREESPVAAVSTEHCLLPETLVLLDSGRFVRAEALEPGEQLLASPETSAVMAIWESPECDRETVILHYMPEVDSSVKSLCILADHSLLVQRPGERKHRVLPAAAVVVGDRLSTKTGGAIVRGKEQVVRRSHTIQIDFPAPVATYVAEAEDLRPEAFVRSLGSFAIPDGEQAHDALKLPRCAGAHDKV